MEEFPSTEHGDFVPKDHLPGILWKWSEVLKLMEEDPRFLIAGQTACRNWH